MVVHKTVPVDLHQHLQTEPDISDISFNEVIDKIREGYGDECILGITNFRDFDSRGLRDDTRYEDFTKLKGYARDNFENHIKVGEVRIIKVQEVPVLYKGEEVHFLCIGLKNGEHIEPRRELLEVLSEIQERRLIIILDHPFARGGVGKYLIEDKKIEKRVLSTATAIEVFNGLTDRSFPFVGDGASNKRTESYFDSIKEDYPKLGSLVGTDGQSLNALKRGSYSLLNISLEDKIADSELVKRLETAIKEHRDTRGDKKISQNRFEIFKHVCGIVKEAGIKNTLSRL